MARQPENLIKFAYELRKQDLNDEYSNTLLEGQVQPNVLVQIIMSNQWNTEQGKMVLNENQDCFKI